MGTVTIALLIRDSFATFLLGSIYIFESGNPMQSIRMPSKSLTVTVTECTSLRTTLRLIGAATWQDMHQITLDVSNAPCNSRVKILQLLKPLQIRISDFTWYSKRQWANPSWNGSFLLIVPPLLRVYWLAVCYGVRPVGLNAAISTLDSS